VLERLLRLVRSNLQVPVRVSRNCRRAHAADLRVHACPRRLCSSNQIDLVTLHDPTAQETRLVAGQLPRRKRLHSSEEAFVNTARGRHQFIVEEVRLGFRCSTARVSGAPGGSWSSPSLSDSAPFS